MSFPAGLYTAGQGIKPENLEVPYVTNVNPPASAIFGGNAIGKRWINKGVSEWLLLSYTFTNNIQTANWIQVVATTLNVTGAGVTAAMTAGVVVVNDPTVTAASVITYSRATTGGTVGQVSITAQSAGTFTLTSSSNTETSTFAYTIVN